MKRFLVALSLATVACLAWAIPSVDEVQSEVRKGNFAQAESMMREVVAANPDSARAHYVLAEILAHNKRFDQAVAEVTVAKRLDPKLSFTQSDKFQQFEQLLERERAATRSAEAAQRAAATQPVVLREPARSGGGVPGWLWGLGGAVVAVAIWRLIAARRETVYPANVVVSGSAGAVVPGGYQPGYGPGYGPGYAPPGGSGMLGTGIAAAGGFAAGMLAEKLIDGGHHDAGDQARRVQDTGYTPGVFDDANSASRALESRDVDFGSGDGWGGDAGGGGGGGDGPPGW